MRQKKLKTAIIILSLLLVLSLSALVGILIYRSAKNSTPSTVTVTDNIVTPDAETSSSSEAPSSDSEGNGHTESSSSTANTYGSAAQKNAVTLSLHKRNADDNTPFNIKNMLPGDSETNYYRISVSQSGNVVLQFHADIRPDYEKLSDVLKCRIALPEKSEVLYDGLMKDMPISINLLLNTYKSTVSEVCYEITAYLDTSAGNEYMDNDLIADFRWWVEETENLNSPQTGVPLDICLCLCLTSCSLLLLILIVKKRKKEVTANEQQQ